jgi:hypothetical protein
MTMTVNPEVRLRTDEEIDADGKAPLRGVPLDDAGTPEVARIVVAAEACRTTGAVTHARIARKPTPIRFHESAPIGLASSLVDTTLVAAYLIVMS